MIGYATRLDEVGDTFTATTKGDLPAQAAPGRLRHPAATGDDASTPQDPEAAVDQKTSEVPPQRRAANGVDSRHTGHGDRRK